MATVATVARAAASEDAKIDVFAIGDEFEDFDIGAELEDDKDKGKEGLQQWEDDWDDNYINNDFSLQLRKELENMAPFFDVKLAK